ncbi:hypothetical protein [Chitiniphilus shinanonensis]|uniref:hypothetical protein n=1 Tax=Chitiniphilus shinanonensis TaxID=553088 RepID=UPI00307433B4
MSTPGAKDQTNHDLASILREYWICYGGLPALVKSPFLWLSIGLLILTCQFWTTEDWWDQVISIMPNILGFTLGGFAVFLGFGDEKFKAIISGKDPEEGDCPSPYMEVCSAFLHFVMVQVASILIAVVSKALDFPTPELLKSLQPTLQIGRLLGGLFGYWLFLYGLCIALASAIAIFRVALWYDGYQTGNRDDPSS